LIAIMNSTDKFSNIFPLVAYILSSFILKDV
jgi:hypothetical protein